MRESRLDVLWAGHDALAMSNHTVPISFCGWLAKHEALGRPEMPSITFKSLPEIDMERCAWNSSIVHRNERWNESHEMHQKIGLG